MVSYVEKNRNRKAEGKAQNETAQPNSRDIDREATHEVHGVDEAVTDNPADEVKVKRTIRKRKTTTDETSKKNDKNDD